MKTMKHFMTKAAGMTAATGLGLLPLFAAAQDFGQYSVVAGNSTGGLQLLLYRVQLIYNQIFPIMLAIGVLYFIWGVIEYITKPSPDGNWKIAYGLIGLFVIVSIWGLVAFVGDTIGIKGTTAPNTLPYVTPTPPNSPAVVRP